MVGARNERFVLHNGTSVIRRVFGTIRNKVLLSNEYFMFSLDLVKVTIYWWFPLQTVGFQLVIVHRFSGRLELRFVAVLSNDVHRAFVRLAVVLLVEDPVLGHLDERRDGPLLGPRDHLLVQTLVREHRDLQAARSLEERRQPLLRDSHAARVHEVQQGPHVLEGDVVQDDGRVVGGWMSCQQVL